MVCQFLTVEGTCGSRLREAWNEVALHKSCGGDNK